MRFGVLIIGLLLFQNPIYSQEVLFQENFSKNKQVVIYPFFAKSYKKQTLVLPFFDDFYQDSFQLKNTLWDVNENVQIHFGIGLAPPNRGVVVIDGAKKNGQAYYDTPTQGINERLVSLPMDLSTYNLSDSLYFSFFFMHGGYGDKAESSDSLKLFFVDSAQTSHLVWFRTGGDTMSQFQRVIVPVNDSKFYHANFQFYFETYGNLNGLFDQWLLDYIYLDKNRTHNDTLFTDVSFSDKRFSIFDSLTAIPLKQFESKAWMSQNLIEVTNLGANNEGRNLTWSIEEIKNNTPLNPPLTQNQFFAFFPPKTSYPIPPFAEQTNLIDKFSKFQVEFSLNQNASDPQVFNDTLRLRFPIDSVWAYDDGEPETGYGLRTAKTFVQKFYNNTSDSLKAVLINFVPNIDILSGKGFKLVVLHALHRDSTIYSKFYNLNHLSTRDSFNYFLLDSIIPLPNEYYIGITQPDNKPIGVGFDFSYNNNHNIYWDSSSVFVKSRLNGTLMIRPVMGSKPELLVSKELTSLQDIKIYPNPVSDYLFLDFESNVFGLELYDSIGKLIKYLKPEKVLDLRDLNSGFYFLKISNGERTCIKKIIKSN